MTFPAITRTAIRLMASLTESHIQRFLFLGYCHFPNFSVTQATYLLHVLYGKVRIENKFSNVFFVGEMHVVRYVVHFFPAR